MPSTRIFHAMHRHAPTKARSRILTVDALKHVQGGTRADMTNNEDKVANVTVEMYCELVPTKFA